MVYHLLYGAGDDACVVVHLRWAREPFSDNTGTTTRLQYTDVLFNLLEGFALARKSSGFNLRRSSYEVYNTLHSTVL